MTLNEFIVKNIDRKYAYNAKRKVLYVLHTTVDEDVRHLITVYGQMHVTKAQLSCRTPVEQDNILEGIPVYFNEESYYPLDDIERLNPFEVQMVGLTEVT